MAIHGKPRAKALAAIPNCDEFTAGGRVDDIPNFRGEKVVGLPGVGALSEIERVALHGDYLVHGIDYVVWSYQTPIAWHMPNGDWHIVEEKFSVSTTNHQSVIRLALLEWLP